ncbi:hypothetical protein FHS19_000459 [Paenibacillus rhizosphaerae]|uniref:NEAT domain-containing protein n=1 Tax=Paenibacillus rhizosphaerae TaxID=297318 RepID=A0A839TG75_9BACL|nr:hypothetical protein [Paenibacillus rhizosphaerae]MBB3125805.1 hypothetical protein [Paenibacillus rhizosphaerae]
MDSFIKKLGLWIAAVLLFVVAGATPALAAAGSGWNVKLVSVQLVENEHVGNEWYYIASVNGKEVEEGGSVAFKNVSSINLYAYAEEQDKVPDKAKAQKTIKVSTLTKKTQQVEMKVTVTENRGRYSGNQAVWKFTFQISKK